MLRGLLADNGEDLIEFKTIVSVDTLQYDGSACVIKFSANEKYPSIPPKDNASLKSNLPSGDDNFTQVSGSGRI